MILLCRMKVLGELGIGYFKVSDTCEILINHKKIPSILIQPYLSVKRKTHSLAKAQ